MGENNMRDEDKRNEEIMQYVSRLYRRSRFRTDQGRLTGDISRNAQAYADSLSFIAFVDRILMECSVSSRHVITHDYLMKSDPKWYLSYFSRSSYYAAKKQAVREFIACMRI
jgi:hypothetical protein